jgi:hypothetical protein
MACCKRVLIRRVAVAFALPVAGWASAGCGALIGVDPGDPIDPAPEPTVALDDPSIGTGAGERHATDAASEPSNAKAEAGTASSPASPDENAEASATSVSEGPGEQDAMAASSGPTMSQPMSNPSPDAAPKGDADPLTACPKGDQGGGGPGKGPAPGCNS